jgi:threonine aldolase
MLRKVFATPQCVRVHVHSVAQGSLKYRDLRYGQPSVRSFVFHVAPSYGLVIPEQSYGTRCQTVSRYKSRLAGFGTMMSSRCTGTLLLRTIVKRRRSCSQLGNSGGGAGGGDRMGFARASSNVLATARPGVTSRFSSSSSTTSTIVDLRSDTVTRPSRAMLERALTAPVGDDVMGEDPTVLALQDHMADLFGKERALFVPTGTMANLVALLAHCRARASEIIVGAASHINLWEGGNASNLGGIHTRQILEDEKGEMDDGAILDCFRTDQDDHWPETALLCLENTHNMAGGVALPKVYMDRMGHLAHGEMKIKVHVDGARIFNSAVAQGLPVKDLCEHADSVSVCLSKGLGAPLGSVLVGEAEFIRLAKRARKRCGGGMRQAGVVAAMGMYAVENNVDRLVVDHERAKTIGKALHDAGFYIPGEGKVDTNIVYFAPPEKSTLTREEFLRRLGSEYGVKLSGGYSSGGRLYRLVTHMDIDDEGVDRAIEGIVTLGTTA